MQITAFDYAKGQDANSSSLTKLATIIHQARSEAETRGAPCLLFDNGDTFQGSPLGDPSTSPEVRTGAHPMVTCINHLKYDACGLGNHDFDYGLEHLRGITDALTMPVLCSNLTCDVLPSVKRHKMIDVVCPTAGTSSDRLKVGVMSSIPTKTMFWNRHHLENIAQITDPIDALKSEAGRMRAQGADIIVALAHMGLALFDEGPDAQNRIADVCALDEIDVVIGGHTHLRFPGPDHASLEQADCVTGKVLGKPLVQPGASAAEIGVIDLDLARDADGKWRIENSSVELRAPDDATPPDADLENRVSAAHTATRDYLAKPVRKLAAPMNSFFALVHPSPVTGLMAAAKRRAIARRVSGTQYGDLPLVAAVSTPLTGGFDGPGNFFDIPDGYIHRHHVAGMNPFANHVWAVKATGAQLADWLERSSLVFNTLEENNNDQMLLDPSIPGFRFDAIYGLTYEIDIRRPPSFDRRGRRIEGRAPRVRDIRRAGELVKDDDAFLVVTTDHRAAGGGLYEAFSTKAAIVQGRMEIQSVLLDYLEAPSCKEVREETPWRFAQNMNRTAIYLTAPAAKEHLSDIAHLKPEPCGQTPEGFLKLRLQF